MLTVQQYSFHSCWIIVNHVEHLNDSKHTGTSYIGLRVSSLEAYILPMTSDLSTLVSLHQLLIESLDHYLMLSNLRVVRYFCSCEYVVSFLTQVVLQFRFRLTAAQQLLKEPTFVVATALVQLDRF